MAVQLPLRQADSPLAAGGRGRAVQRGMFNGTGLLLTALLVLLVVWPLLSMVLQDVDGHSARVVLDDAQFGKAARNTAILVVVPGAISVVLGSLFAWLNERTDARIDLLATAVPLAPLVLPQVALAIGWIFLADSGSGLLNVAIRALLGHAGVHLSQGPFNVTSWEGMIFLYTIVFVPFVYILMSAALRNVDPALEEASRVSGGSSWRTLRLVTLPAVRPAIGGSCFLVLLLGMAQYSIPRTVGATAKIDVLSTYLVRLFQSYPPEQGAAVFVGLLVLLVMIVAWILERLFTRRQGHGTITGKSGGGSVVRLGPARWMARAVVLLYLLIASVLPLIALVLVALQPYWTAHPDLGAMTLANYRTFFADPGFRKALLDSISLGAIGATIGMLGTAILVCYARLRGGRIFRIVDLAARAPGAISHVVLAVAFLLALGGAPLHLAGTMGILILAYVVINVPQAWISAQGALDQVGQPVLDASAISGATNLRTFLRINLPLMAGGLAAGWAMLFVVIVGDLNASSILAGPNTPVVGSVILSIFDAGTYSQIAALGSVVAVLTGFVICVVMAYSRRLERGARDDPGAQRGPELTAAAAGTAPGRADG